MIFAINGPETVVCEDLYGCGIRMGLYLQGAAYLVNVVSIEEIDYSLQILGTVLSVATLAAWTKVMQSQQISPAEAWVVLGLITSFLVPLLSLEFVI
jgi:hypothetical protein